VKTVNGSSTLLLTCNRRSTILELKIRLASIVLEKGYSHTHPREPFPVFLLCLEYLGKVLEDDGTLASYSIANNSTLILRSRSTVTKPLATPTEAIRGNTLDPLHLILPDDTSPSTSVKKEEACDDDEEDEEERRLKAKERAALEVNQPVLSAREQQRKEAILQQQQQQQRQLKQQLHRLHKKHGRRQRLEQQELERQQLKLQPQGKPKLSPDSHMLQEGHVSSQPNDFASDKETSLPHAQLSKEREEERKEREEKEREEEGRKKAVLGSKLPGLSKYQISVSYSSSGLSSRKRNKLQKIKEVLHSTPEALRGMFEISLPSSYEEIELVNSLFQELST